MAIVLPVVGEFLVILVGNIACPEQEVVVASALTRVVDGCRAETGTSSQGAEHPVFVTGTGQINMSDVSSLGKRGSFLPLWVVGGLNEVTYLQLI